MLVPYLAGWHAVTGGVIGGAQDGAVRAARSVAAREEAADCGPRRRSEAARRGALDVIGWEGPLGGRNVAVLRPVHVGGDGAPGIGNLAADHVGTRTDAVDCYHARAHLWTVRLPIGSGAVESSARQVVQHRMKRAGRRGADHGGRAMLALRAGYASGRVPDPRPNGRH